GFLKSHGYEGRIQADSNLYTYSNRTHEAFLQAGISQDTLPLELNYKELLHRNCEESEMLIYGKIPLMITAGCVAKSLGRCQKKKSRYFLKDRYGKEFSIKTDCTNCYNLIYNSQPLALFGMAKEVKKIHPASYRLHFTGENLKQMEEILELFRRVYVQNQPFLKDEIKFEYTNGHMKRGVE
ncbi:MAG: U32 family peptidase, partial [Lachnospiraceae bacterium]